MNSEAFVPVILVVLIILCGLFLKRYINLRTIGKLIHSIAKKIDSAWHSMPLWVRLTILLSLPFIFFYIYAIDVELNHPEKQFTIHDLPFLP